MAWTNVYDTSYPDGATMKVPVLDDAIKTLAKALQERLNVCLYFPLTGTQVSDDNAGKIRKIIYKEAITKPTLAAGEGALYTKTVNGIAELFWQQADGTEKQLTTGGKLKVIDTDILLTNAAWLVALNAAGDGNVNLIKAGRNEANNADVAVLPDKVRTATNAAPEEDTQIANKKFLDDQRKYYAGNNTPSPLSENIFKYEGQESITDANGLIKKFGYSASSLLSHPIITFSTPFPNACVFVGITAIDSAGQGNPGVVITGSVSVNGFQATSSGQTAGFYWETKGY